MERHINNALTDLYEKYSCEGQGLPLCQSIKRGSIFGRHASFTTLRIAKLAERKSHESIDFASKQLHLAATKPELDVAR